jgi:hypothetical protein
VGAFSSVGALEWARNMEVWFQFRSTAYRGFISFIWWKLYYILQLDMCARHHPYCLKANGVTLGTIKCLCEVGLWIQIEMLQHLAHFWMNESYSCDISETKIDLAMQVHCNGWNFSVWNDVGLICNEIMQICITECIWYITFSVNFYRSVLDRLV